MNWQTLMELVAIGQDEVGSLARQLYHQRQLCRMEQNLTRSRIAKQGAV